MASEHHRFRPAQSWLASAQAYIAFFSALIGVLAAAQSFSSASTASDYKRQMEQKANDRADREVMIKHDAAAYEAVIKVLEIRDAGAEVMDKRQRAAVALVMHTASDGVKPALLEVLRTSPGVSQAVRDSLELSREIISETGGFPTDHTAGVSGPVTTPTGAPPTAAELAGYKVVLFHCESLNQPENAERNKQMALAMLAELKGNSALAKVSVESKLLPEMLNASPGYAVHSNQIRYNPEDQEEASSLALKAVLEQTAVRRQNQVDFERRAVKKRTPRYLSVFLCGRSAQRA